MKKTTVLLMLVFIVFLAGCQNMDDETNSIDGIFEDFVDNCYHNSERVVALDNDSEDVTQEFLEENKELYEKGNYKKLNNT